MKIKNNSKFFKEVDLEMPPVTEDINVCVTLGPQYYELVMTFLWVLTLCGLAGVAAYDPGKVNCALVLTGLAIDWCSLGATMFIIAYVVGWVFVYVAHRNKTTHS